LLDKIKKEVGALKDTPGFMVFILNRVRMYTSLFGISFLVLERFFAIMDIELGFSEYLKSLPAWAIYLGLTGTFLFGLVWMYVDLKFIFPSEKRTSTKRDPFIQEILEGINDLRGNSKLEQQPIPKNLTWAVGKDFPKSKHSSG